MSDEAVTEAARLTELAEMIVALASNDLARRASVGDGSTLIDGMAGGLNMLAEELARARERDLMMQKRITQGERLAAVGQLAAGVAHEVNNPATVVLANSRFLVEANHAFSDAVAELRALFPVASPERAAVAGVLAAHGLERALDDGLQMLVENVGGIERIVSIVKDLRAFSRTDALGPVDLNQLAVEACAVVHHEASYRAQLVCERSQVPLIHADRSGLMLVLTTLLVNAIDAIAEGAPKQNRITVTTYDNETELVLSVHDTGCGMTEEIQAHLFEPFFTTKPRETGTGLGLVKAAEIVRLYGGRIDFESRAGHGSLFRVHFPKSAATPVPAPKNETRRKRLLMIDDEPTILRVYARMFKTRYDVVCADSGANALALLASDAAFDVVFCDLMMPEMDGVAVYQEIERRHPALAPRVFWISGGAFTQRTQAFTTAHADRLLEKPVQVADIERAVEALR